MREKCDYHLYYGTNSVRMEMGSPIKGLVNSTFYSYRLSPRVRHRFDSIFFQNCTHIVVMYRKIERIPLNPLLQHSIIRLRLNTLQLVGVKRKSRQTGP